uniref:Uncharacterized protein n=1 Tax=Steinernema glaseri TaxID=37863 RepID=A0A1I8ABZ9_9BILA
MLEFYQTTRHSLPDIDTSASCYVAELPDDPKRVSRVVEDHFSLLFHGNRSHEKSSMHPTDNAFVKIKDTVSKTVKGLRRRSREIRDDLKKAPSEIRAIKNASTESFRGFVNALKNENKVPKKMNIEETVEALFEVAMMLGCFWVGALLGNMLGLPLTWLKPLVDVPSIVLVNYFFVPLVFFVWKIDLPREHLLLLAGVQGLLLGYVFNEYSDPNLFPLGILHALLNAATLRFCSEQSENYHKKFFVFLLSLSFFPLMVVSRFAGHHFLFSLLCNGFYVAGVYAVFQLRFNEVHTGRTHQTLFKVAYLTVALYVQTLMRLQFGVKRAIRLPGAKTEL